MGLLYSTCLQQCLTYDVNMQRYIQAAVKYCKVRRYVSAVQCLRQVAPLPISLPATPRGITSTMWTHSDPTSRAPVWGQWHRTTWTRVPSTCWLAATSWLFWASIQITRARTRVSSTDEQSHDIASTSYVCAHHRHRHDYFRQCPCLVTHWRIRGQGAWPPKRPTIFCSAKTDSNTNWPTDRVAQMQKKAFSSTAPGYFAPDPWPGALSLHSAGGSGPRPPFWFAFGARHVLPYPGSASAVTSVYKRV